MGKTSYEYLSNELDEEVNFLSLHSIIETYHVFVSNSSLIFKSKIKIKK